MNYKDRSHLFISKKVPLPVPTGYEAGWAPEPEWMLKKKRKILPQGIEPGISSP
jgi:hypothetical protein